MALTRQTLTRGALAAGILALAAGCTLPTTYKWDWQQWNPDKLGYAAGQGAVLTEIRGNPFDAPKSDVDAVITETMYKSHFGPPVPFVTQAPQDYKSPYRVVILFDPDETLNSDKLCKETPQPGPSDPGLIRIAAAFCAQDIHETSVWGSVGRTADPNDPQFKALIRSMTTQLFPNEDPNRRDDDNDWVSQLPLDPAA